MNDQNIPPVPPPYPIQPPQAYGPGAPAYGQPAHQQSHPGQRPYGQGYAAQQTYGEAQYQQPNPGQPTFGQDPYTIQAYQHPGAALQKTSGYRLASGIVGIGLGVWLFFSFIIGISLGLGAVLILTLIGCFGSIACGIVLVAKQRDRGRGAPITMICVAGASLIVSSTSPAQFLFTLMLALPIFIVMGIGLAREGRAPVN